MTEEHTSLSEVADEFLNTEVVANVTEEVEVYEPPRKRRKLKHGVTSLFNAVEGAFVLPAHRNYSVQMRGNGPVYIEELEAGTIVGSDQTFENVTVEYMDVTEDLTVKNLIATNNVQTPNLTVTTLATLPNTNVSGQLNATTTYSKLYGYPGTSTISHLRPSLSFYRMPTFFASTASGGIQYVFSMQNMANSLSAPGDFLKLTAYGKTGPSANAKLFRILMDVTAYSSTPFTVSVGNVFKLEATISYHTRYTCNIHWIIYEGVNGVISQKMEEGIAVPDWTIDGWNWYLQTSTGTTVNDIIVRNAHIEVVSA